MNFTDTLKESLIYLARHTLGESITHDYLIRRGLKVRQLHQYYSYAQESHCIHTSEKNPQTLIFMADGKWMHGGLTDRIRGMASAWDFAQSHHLNFKIFHTSPFPLKNILSPNKVNWIIEESDISWNSKESKPVLLYRKDFENIHALERQLDKEHSQFHLYSCIDSIGENFPKFFNELFTPSEYLQQELDKYKILKNAPYGAVSFRMQNLLGDFPEGKFKCLATEEQKQDLLESALKSLNRIIRDNPQWEHILVTADSPSLLNQAAELPKVITVSGKSVHIDFHKSKKANDYIKAFVEFLLISKAQKSILYQNRKYRTYPSNFPKYAASLGNIPFEINKD